MANGGTLPQNPQPGRGKTSRVTAGMLAAAMGMNAATARDRFADESSAEPAPMTASAYPSDAESLSGAKSPIQNADMSYAARASEGGTEAERLRQAGMLETGEQFAGAPSIPTTETLGTNAEQPPGEETEEDQTVQQARQAQDYAADSARLNADRQHRATLAQAQGEEQNKLDVQSTEKRTAMIWRGITTTSGLAWFTGVGTAVYLFVSNIRLFKTLFGDKDYTYISKATLPQMGMTVYSNCMACFVGMPASCCVAMTILIGVAAFAAAAQIKSLFGL